MRRDPAREWQERYASHGTELAFKPETNTNVFSSVYPICNAPRIVRTTLSPGLVFRDSRMVNDGNDNVNLAISFERDFHLCQRGLEVCLGRNEATIMQADRPGTAATRRQFKVVEISISQRDWRMRSAHPGDAVMRVISRDSETLKLLIGYISVLAKVGQPTGGQAREALQRHLIDLTVLAATEPLVGESEVGCVVAARRAAVLEYIAAHFQDPGLSGSSLGQRLGISQRYLQRLLQQTGKSFTEHVNELRLERAFAALAAGNRRVSDIAFEVGFSDVSHFYRLFKSRFGETPKGIHGTAKASHAS